MEHHLTDNREQFCVVFAMVYFDESIIVHSSFCCGSGYTLLGVYVSTNI
jgi:hypothetical protein